MVSQEGEGVLIVRWRHPSLTEREPGLKNKQNIIQSPIHPNLSPPLPTRLVSSRLFSILPSSLLHPPFIPAFCLISSIIYILHSKPSSNNLFSPRSHVCLHKHPLDLYFYKALFTSYSPISVCSVLSVLSVLSTYEPTYLPHLFFVPSWSRSTVVPSPCLSSPFPLLSSPPSPSFLPITTLLVSINPRNHSHRHFTSSTTKSYKNLFLSLSLLLKPLSLAIAIAQSDSLASLVSRYLFFVFVFLFSRIHSVIINPSIYISFARLFVCSFVVVIVVYIGGQILLVPESFVGFLSLFRI